jgi:hypothetical protein
MGGGGATIAGKVSATCAAVSTADVVGSVSPTAGCAHADSDRQQQMLHTNMLIHPIAAAFFIRGKNTVGHGTQRWRFFQLFRKS